VLTSFSGVCAEALLLTPALHGSSADTEKQIQFARHHFDNLQNLIRFVDTKAAALMSIVIFLGASGIQVAKEAISALHFSGGKSSFSGVLFLSGCSGFLLSFAWMVIHVEKVLRPRGARHYPEIKIGQDLMWQDHVLQHGTNTTYFHAVRAASPEILLRNITDQVFELCHISKEKTDAFHRARVCFWVALCSWVLTIVCGILVVRWK
jgi:hypothetical protein